jgi:sulfide:quinone oxidoreductase
LVIKPLTPRLSVAPQLTVDDIARVARSGYRSIICNRPDEESPDQPSADDIRAAAQAAGLAFAYIPAISGALTDANASAMRSALETLPAPTLAYCRSGARAEKLAQMAGLLDDPAEADTCDVLIVGGGSAGIATAASILKRRRGIRLTILDPSEMHYYQPGWTMVGAGIFGPDFTRRAQADLIPRGARWIRNRPPNSIPRNGRSRSATAAASAIRC